MWRAARYGLASDLVSPETMTTEPAETVVGELLDFVAEGLAFHGDSERVRRLVGRILADGNGAARQRRARDEAGSDGALMDYVREQALRRPT